MAIVKYRAPTPPERTMLFSWLKFASSWTAWSRLLEREKVFSSVVERAYKQDKLNPQRPGKPLIPDDWMSDVFASESAFQMALDRLRRGDRRCFVFLGARGHFNQGVLNVTWWRDMDARERYMGGAAFSPNESPLWPEIEKAMNDCLGGLSRIGIVLQLRHTDVPAPLDNLDRIPPKRWAWLATLVPRDPARAAVPAPPSPHVNVKTGKTIPTFGIWEPVNGPGGDVDGPMNYLHGGHPAPTVGFANDGPRREGRSTTWRLLWADDRYGDQPIPPEESDYHL